MWPFKKREPEPSPFKLIGKGLVQKYPICSPGMHSLVNIYEFGGRKFYREFEAWQEIEARHKLEMVEVNHA